MGGSVQYPRGYLKRAFELVREKGGVCIADEVQTGFGRTGDHYWGFQGHGVVPDIGLLAHAMQRGAEGAHLRQNIFQVSGSFQQKVGLKKFAPELCHFPNKGNLCACHSVMQLQMGKL